MPNPENQNRRIGVIVHTTDGGQTWTETLLEQLGDKDTALNSIHFVNPNLGWIVGATSKNEEAPEGTLLKTSDGGKNWSVSTLPFKQVPTSVHFIDPNRGWMGGVTPLPTDEDEDGGPSDILATTNGGATWQAERRLPISVAEVFFLDNNIGWISGYKGAIYQTTDGGRNWNRQRSELEFDESFRDPSGDGAKNFVISGIHFFDAQHGLAAAVEAEDDIGRIVGTTNGGASWSKKMMSQDDGIRDVYLLSPTEGWAIAKFPKYIYHTLDGGSYWETETIEFEQEVPFFKIAGADSSHIWAVGGGAIFFRVP
jgi:photosystem II stability/assembly factor-like uncharacterized protein